MLLLLLLQVALEVSLHVYDDLSLLLVEFLCLLMKALLELIGVLEELLFVILPPLVLLLLFEVRSLFIALQLLVALVELLHFGLKQIYAVLLLGDYQLQLFLLGFVIYFKFDYSLLGLDQRRGQ